MRLLLMIVTGAALIAGFLAIVWYGNDLHRVGVPGDPNNPRAAGMLTPEILRRLLRGASDAYLARQERREITEPQFKELMAKAADDMLAEVKIDRIPKDKAWEYGEVFITARHWEDAERALKIAVSVAKDEDRRVNDSLRLARVEAELGNVQEAIRLARSTFGTPNEGAAPILMACLYEIVPVAEGKGHDIELAKLLEDAIKCHMRTVVKPNTPAGRDFLAARPYHVSKAWDRILALYLVAGRQDLASAARARGQAMMSRTGNI